MFSIQKMDLVVAVYIFCIMTSELLGAKTFQLFQVGGFQLNASVALFVLPLLFTISDIVAEVHGKARARSIAQAALVVIVCVFLFSLLATTLTPSSRFAPTEAAYDRIFHTSARFAAASLIATSVALLADIMIFTKLKQRLGKRELWLRNNVSNFLSQFLDTVIFMTLAFYDISHSPRNNMIFLVGLILPFWLLKCFVSVVETPLVYVGVKWLKR